MPKTLFYAGIVMTLFAALLAVAQAVNFLWGTPAAPRVDSYALIEAQTYLLALLLLLSIPVAALFIRMATLLAARDLFASFFAMFFVSSTALCMALLTATQLRLRMVVESLGLLAASADGQRLRDTLSSVMQLHLAAFLAFGFFFSMALLAVRPYFKVQASRLLSALLYFPGVLWAWVVVEQFHAIPRESLLLIAPSAASFTYLSLLATILVGVAVHCLRHRYLFIEVTNLRELLDSRIDGQGAADGGSRLAVGGVAFGN